MNPCEVASNMSRYDGIEYGHRSTEMSSTEALLQRCIDREKSSFQIGAAAAALAIKMTLCCFFYSPLLLGS